MRGSALIAALIGVLLVAGCSSPATDTLDTNSPGTTAAPPAISPVPSPAASVVTLGSLLGAVPSSPPDTEWTRITADGGVLSFEVPSTWTEQQTARWLEDDTAIGVLLSASPSLVALGRDFRLPGVILGISADAGGRTPRSIVDAEDLTGACTGEPAEELVEPGYVGAVRTWSACGGHADAFVIALAFASDGDPGMIALILQGAERSDLGYLGPILASVRTESAIPAVPAPGPSLPRPTDQPPISTTTYTIVINECLLQMNDAIAIGIVRNDDHSSHSYVIKVRFTDQDGVLRGEERRDTPVLLPGEAYRWELRTLAQFATGATCTITDVQEG